ncbi:MAG TPA: DUF4340 domain-containing protein [Lacunisphaera sp.]|jgi:hypothetical protein
MRSKVTIVLLFLNVVLFYYIFHYEKARLDERAVMEARKRVYGPEVATIDSITRTQNGLTIKLERKEGKGETWWLTQPYEWPADPYAVNRMLSELQFLEHDTSFTVAEMLKSGQTLAEYGLEKPSITLTFTSAGKSYVSKIGDNTEIANRLYLLSPDGDRIHVVKRSLADSVGVPLDVLRSKSVFTIPVFEVRSMNVQTPTLKVRLQRDANARWSLEAPISARANKSKVEVTINALTDGLKANDFPDLSASDLERTGLNAPSLSITLEGNLRRETLLLGNPVPSKSNSIPSTSPTGGTSNKTQEYYAKMENKSVVFTVPISHDLIEDLRNAQDTLRDPHMLDFDIPTVTAISLGAPNEIGLTLQQLVSGTPQWQVVVRLSGQAPLTNQADTAIVDELLQKLRLLSKTEYLSDAPTASQLENWGFNRPEREITLNLSSGGGPKRTDASTITLQIGVGQEKGVAFARTTDARFVYQILPDILDATPVIARHYRQRLLRTLPEGARIQGLSLTERESGKPIYVKQLSETQNTWVLAVANESEARRKAIGALLTNLHTLRAKEFTADLFNPDHADTRDGPRPWKYRLDLNFAFPSGDTSAQNPTSTLFLTERFGGNTQVAGTDEFGGAVFEITQELLDAIFTLTYREKNDPGTPASAITPADSTTPIQTEPALPSPSAKP